MTILAQIETAARALAEGTQLVDKAAAQSDRWLFLASLAALLVFAAAVIYWLVKSNERKDNEHREERTAWGVRFDAKEKEYKLEREKDQSAYLTAMGAMKDEIRAMTAELRQNTAVLKQHDTDMRNAHAIETATLVHAELQRLGINISPPSAPPTPTRIIGVST